MRVQRAGAPRRAKAPHVPQQLVLREDAARVAGELQQQLVLLRRQDDPPAGNGDAPRRAVDLDRAGGQPFGLGRRGPAQDGADPRDQLVVVERPVEVVVAPAVEGPHPVDGIGLLRAEQDHWHLSVALAQPAAELEALGVADQHEVGAHTLEELERFPVLDAYDLEPVLRQMSLEEAPRGLLGLCEQDGTRHATDASREVREPPGVHSAESVSKLRQPARTALADQMRPERNTPHSSQRPSTPDKKKPNADTTFSPRIWGPEVAKTPIRLDPINPAATTNAMMSRLAATSILCMKSSRPLCTKPTSIWPSRACSSTSWIWYGYSAKMEASLKDSRRALVSIRCGV